ncbi:MAG: hypothetical protein M0P31_09410 [Solirubrobacteraceae bacterium]|nr:hypothetical protein [Solirubrobacteraceae bacterium]
MCPSPFGRIQTRAATLLGPVILALILWALQVADAAPEGFLVLLGIYLLMGVALDTAFYPLVIRWQPPWLTFVLAVGEFVLIFLLGKALEIGLTDLQAIVFYWVTWVIAIVTKIVVLPFVTLTYIEDGGEFRHTDWTVPDGQQPLAVSLLPEDGRGAAREPQLAREFSAQIPIPDELRGLDAPSRAIRVPDELRGG